MNGRPQAVMKRRDFLSVLQGLNIRSHLPRSHPGRKKTALCNSTSEVDCRKVSNTMGDRQSRAIIIGAGPAGLTAGLELIRQSNIKPIILEAGTEVGGLARTVRYNGNRMDIGGHRFFSKSDRVMQWWLDLFPLETGAEGSGRLCYRGRTREIPAASVLQNADLPDRVMLLRPRKSRIYFLH